MRKMKGFLAAVLAGMMLFSGTAYAAEYQQAYVERQEVGPGISGRSAAETVPAELPENEEAIRAVLQDAFLKHQQLDSIQAKGVMNMSFEIAGEELPMSTRFDMKQKGMQSGNGKLLGSMQMDMLGQQVPMTFFYTDGYYYAETMGVKQKMKMDIEDAVEQANAAAGFDMTENTTAGLYNFNMVEQDGVKTIYYTYDTAFLNQVLNDMMQEQVAALSGVGIGYETAVANCVGETSINAEGYIINDRVSMDMPFTISAEGETMTMNLHIYTGVDYLNPGQPVEDFALPPTDGYVEIPSVY